MSREPCGVSLGTHLVIRRGQWVTEPHTCSKPATIAGPDGVARCVQHDRIARGLSGKWTSTLSSETVPDEGVAE